jgi:hypothetical protein
MGKLVDAVMILGEGPTESFYMNSLRDDYPAQLKNIEPKIPKHSNLTELEKKIEEGISKGYTKIFCMIDMDNKKEGKEKDDYQNLKKRYEKPIVRKDDGINCEVIFFETERCTELFFLYYFKYTTKEYLTSDDVVKAVAKECGYQKNLKFFRKGLHKIFKEKGGSLDTAIKNANISCKDKNRDYTYSQLGRMLQALSIS